MRQAAFEHKPGLHPFRFERRTSLPDSLRTFVWTEPVWLVSIQYGIKKADTEFLFIISHYFIKKKEEACCSTAQQQQLEGNVIGNCVL